MGGLEYVGCGKFLIALDFSECLEVEPVNPPGMTLNRTMQLDLDILMELENPPKDIRLAG